MKATLRARRSSRAIKQHGAALAALGEGGEELGPVGVPAPALDLGELGHEPAGADESGDGLALGVEA